MILKTQRPIFKFRPCEKRPIQYSSKQFLFNLYSVTPAPIVIHCHFPAPGLHCSLATTLPLSRFGLWWRVQWWTFRTRTTITMSYLKTIISLLWVIYNAHEVPAWVCRKSPEVTRRNFSATYVDWMWLASFGRMNWTFNVALRWPFEVFTVSMISEYGTWICVLAFEDGLAKAFVLLRETGFSVSFTHWHFVHKALRSPCVEFESPFIRFASDNLVAQVRYMLIPSQSSNAHMFSWFLVSPFFLWFWK